MKNSEYIFSIALMWAILCIVNRATNTPFETEVICFTVSVIGYFICKQLENEK